MEKTVFNLFKFSELYLVGGTVRDRLLGLKTNDLDFATNLLPDEVEKVLQKAGYKTHDIGKAFGTISFMVGGNKIEITTYRKNEKYQRDNRRPVIEWGKTIHDDLIRRDFTINAMAIDRDGRVVDLFKGQEHLNKGVLETPMDAEEIFSDDPLRILRAVRFRSKFGFKYSESVKEALKSQASKLLYLPRERVLDEFNTILLGGHVGKALADMYAYKLLNYVVPELIILANVDQNSQFHSKNVWLHTIGVVENAPADLALRWAALLHDLGKPFTKTFDTQVHFYNHEEVSAIMSESILHRLGLPRKLSEEIVYLVRNHMRANLYDRKWTDSAVRRFVLDAGEHLDKLLLLSRSDITSHNPSKVQLHLDNLEDLSRRIEELKNYKELKCPLGGKSIMEHFNLSTGKIVGRLKKDIMEALVNGELTLGESEEVYLNFLAGKIHRE